MARFRAIPYAKALHEVVLDQAPEQAEATVDFLDRVSQVVEQVPEFLKVLVTPALSPEAKSAILDSVLDAVDVVEPTRRFLHVVQKSYRMEHLPAIRDAYRDLIDRASGRVRAQIEVPVKLGDADAKRLVSAISDLVGSEVVADFSEAPELLAGFRVQVGSKVFDGSLIGQLEQLRRQTLIEQG